MAVLINFKICDNAKECGGIEVCPSGALSWDEKNKTIKIDNKKCTSCGSCVPSCDVGAIFVAENQKEYSKIKKEIDDDPRKISDLMIDRYGAQPIFYPNLIGEDKFDDQVLNASKLVAAEFFKNETIECLLKSIPIKNLLGGINIKYRKVRLQSDKLMKKYSVKKLPALLFFDNGKLMGKIEGYYQIDDLPALQSKIKKILG
jgi:NAD-dependent dihydropyrimidine dehydrogenase PreA subunit